MGRFTLECVPTYLLYTREVSQLNLTLKMPEILTGDSDVPRIKVGEDFHAGPFTFQDVYKVLVNEIKGSAYFKAINFEKFLFKLKRGDDNAVIIAGVIVILTTAFLCYLISRIFEATEKPTPATKDVEEEKEPPRDFTISQLRDFDGSKDQPIYVGLKGEVFDVSSAADFYGPGQSYSCFAGREASRAMARLSFEEDDLSSTKLEDLGPFERNTLEDWYQKFKYYKSYPVVGRITSPPPPKPFTFAELSEYIGKGIVEAGRVDAPIYMAINGKV